MKNVKGIYFLCHYLFCVLCFLFLLPLGTGLVLAQNTRLWATYYGGTDGEEGLSVVTDAAGNVYLGGDTYSAFGIASGGFQNSLMGLENGFVVKFASSGNRLCATYYGQTHDERNRVAVDVFGNVYLAGYTPSASGIASSGFQNVYGGGFSDAYLVKFTSCFNNILNITATATNIACNPQCTGTATVTPTNGTAPYIYTWSNAQTIQVITGLCSGTYTVTVTDTSNSSAAATVTITQPTALTATSTATSAACGSNGSTTVTAGGGTPGYTYNWNTIPAQTTKTATGLAAGTYTATVTDANGCTKTQTVTVTSNNPMTLSASSTPSGCSTNNGTATVNSTNGTPPYIYSWSNSQTTQTTTELSAGTYTATVTDANGCTGTQIVTIESTADAGELYLPNAFSPNSDGENDDFCLQGGMEYCMRDIHISIYDRWGEKVYESTDPKFCWDGTYQGKWMNTAVFVYYLEATLTNGEKINKKGNMSLIR